MSSEKRTADVSKTTKGVKSRTGCRTCKIRHVKCDETKPSCTRCLSSGRTCDGYDMAVSRPTNTSPLPAVLRYGYFRSKKEDRYFHYFRQSTVLDLVGFYYHSEFWCETVLQFSETSAAVLHAALALSTFHEHLRTSSTPCTSPLFLNQYNKSIAHLCSKNSNQPVQFTLTCCILFICLENAQGNHDMALLHLKNGLNILQDWRKQTCKLPSEERIRENITQVFRRLDMQATVFLDSRKPQINATTIFDDYDAEISIPDCFSSLRDAQLALEIIEIRLLYVLTTKANDATSRTLLLKGSAASYAQWKVAFDTFSVRQYGTMQRRDLQLGLLLALHHQTTSLMLDGKLDPGPNWSEDPRFSQINDLSGSLIRSSSSSNLKFSADLGIIAPLYFTAMNSSSDQLRREAIDLLRTAKTKEGFWEAGTAAMIAENVLKVKEVGTPGIPVTGGIQFLAQVHCIISP